MASDFAHFVRTRRETLRLSQRELAARSGVKQPLIAAIETGRRSPSAAVRQALQRALAVRPSVIVASHRDAIRQAFERAGLAPPVVFGSVARGDDQVGSDLDLMVDFTDHYDIADLLALEEELTDLLTIGVDVVDGRGSGPVLDRARAEGVAL